MRILLINNFHYLRGGAERSYFDTAEILKEKGHQVAFFSTANDQNYPTDWSKYFVSYHDLEGEHNWKDKLRIVVKFFYNREAKKKLRELLKDFQPQVAHLHNIYHHLSPSVIGELKKQGIPVVMTLHDYKLICPNYNLFAHGQIWEESKKRKYYRCVRDKCVKNSYAKSLVCTLEAYFHEWWGIYKSVDGFISPSRFLIDKFREFSFNEKIYHLPNPILGKEGISAKKEKGEGKQKYILYFGRLSEEKGIMDLVDAYEKMINRSASSKSDIYLKIVGDGPQKEQLEREVSRKGLQEKVELAGSKEWSELKKIISGAEVVVFPSGWYENYPYSVLEAQSLGVPVIGADIGGVSEMIQDSYNGFLYESGATEQLSRLMEKAIHYPVFLSQMGEDAAHMVKRRNDQGEYYRGLLDIYNKVIDRK